MYVISRFSYMHI